MASSPHAHQHTTISHQDWLGLLFFHLSRLEAVPIRIWIGVIGVVGGVMVLLDAGEMMVLVDVWWQNE